MHRHSRHLLGTLATLAITASLHAQAAPNEQTRAVADGGISVAGWAGAVDANEAKSGMTIANAKFASEGKGFHVTTGPASTYWNTKTPAKGDFTVKATFTEPKFQNLNDHPHPYGIVIGANGMDGAAGSALYCAAYGTGTFIFRGFAPAPFQLGGRRATAHDAVHKAAGVGQPVTQEIAISVKGDRVECSINGTVVAGYSKAEVIGEGKLKSTDGFVGLRFGHNTEVMVTGFTISK
ncbi:MAG: hypothetical protein K2X99_12275 [Gemmatimonadaceae bacterium]|nr:hypothetical protein [Gemmatimonadaceae bacterium]